MQNFVKKIKQVPQAYLHLALLNLGLLISLYKNFSLLYIIISLVFTIVLVTFIATRIFNYFDLKTNTQISLINPNLKTRIASIKEKLLSFVEMVNQKQQEVEESRMDAIIVGLLVCYAASNFLCPCVQVILVVNAFFFVIFGDQCDGVCQIGDKIKGFYSMLKK